MKKQTALVLGVRSEPSFNLGWHISDELVKDLGPENVVNADWTEAPGVRHVNVRNWVSLDKLFETVQPQIVVYSIGVNRPAGVREIGVRDELVNSFNTNCLGMVQALYSWQAHFKKKSGTGQFVAIVSNSARIPRSRSLPYCASKAAQAMALRVAAREMRGNPGWVYGYEPGLLDGTPMTNEARENFHGPLHRMQGVASSGLDAADLARLVAFNIKEVHAGLNGCLIPFDADEL